MSNLLDLNQQLATTRQFLKIYAEQEKQILAQIAEATADADKSTLDAITALGMVKGTPQEVDAVKAKRVEKVADDMPAQPKTK